MSKQIQTIVSNDFESFVICKEFSNSVGIISTFCKNGNSFKSDLKVDPSRTYRLENIQSQLPDLCEINTTDKYSELDSISKIDVATDIFTTLRRLKSGILHYDASYTSSELSDVKYCDIGARLLIRKYTNPSTIKIKLKSNDLKIDKMKIFTIMMVRGFLTCIATNSKIVLHLVVCNPSKNLIGYCANLEDQHKMLRNINLFWPILETEREKKSVKINLKEDFSHILGNEKTKEYPVYIYMERKLDSELTDITHLGESIFVK